MSSSIYDSEKVNPPSEGSVEHEERSQMTQRNDYTVEMSDAKRAYLLERHGTLDLEPIPEFDDADPYNWSPRKKLVNLLLVAFHAMMATFTASSIQSAFEDIAVDLNVSLQRATYLTSLFIAILGGAPLFWLPLSKRFGRRPIFLLSLICSLAGNVGCGYCTSYASMAICRAIVAWFISPAAAIGSAVVKETYFKQDRARYMGIWTLLTTLGIPLAPFIFGFVAQHIGYQWIYWILACINGAQFVLYLFLGPESRYFRSASDDSSAGIGVKSGNFSFSRIDPTPFTIREVLEPFTFFFKPCVIFPAFAYSMVFLFANVMITVELPELFQQKFGFNSQQVGYQFLGTIIGSVIGEQIGGFTSDYWMKRRSRKLGSITGPEPEFRLWLLYPGFLLAICGVIVFLVQLQNAAPMHWNVSPIIGTGIAAVGNQLITTVSITYAVDCYSEQAATVGVFITFVRQIWGFTGPFWLPQMFSSCGLYISAVIATVLIVGCGIVPIIFVQWKGRKLRE